MSITTNDQDQGLDIAKGGIVNLVAQRVQVFLEKGELNLPAGYSAPNALKAAWLILQDTKTRDKRPVLQACNRTSIANALLDMVVQGLNPAKKQCYFIAYGDQLTCQRSYFGTMAVAKLVNPAIEDIVAEVIYDGDVCTYHIERGKKIITEHEQTLENVERGVIKGAYCTIYYADGRISTEIMTISQIYQAWKQSQMNPFDDKGELKATSTHGKFTAEMAKKTVINRACKPIINASDDTALLQTAISRSQEIEEEAVVADEIAEHANQELLDIEDEVTAKDPVSLSEGPASDTKSPVPNEPGF